MWLVQNLHLPSQSESDKEYKKIKNNLLEGGKVVEVQVEVSDFFEQVVDRGEVGGECYHRQGVAVDGVGGVRGADSTSFLI